MATIKVKDDLYSSAAYGNLDSDERALFWELLGMTRFGEMIRIEDAAYKLRRPADAKPCRSVKQSIQILERAGLVHVEDGRLEVVSAFAYAHSNALSTAKARAKKKAAEAISPKPTATTAAQAEPVAETVAETVAQPAPKKKRTTQVSRSAIPAGVKFDIPPEFDPALFQRFLEIRASNNRKKIIQETADDWALQIRALRTSGVDLAKALRCAVSNSWQGFYPIKNGWIDPLAPEVSQTPEPLVVNLPDFVPADLFNEYLEKRAQFADKPLDQAFLNGLIQHLEDLFARNYAMSAVIKRSIEGNKTRPYMKFVEDKADMNRSTGRGRVSL